MSTSGGPNLSWTIAFIPSDYIAGPAGAQPTGVLGRYQTIQAAGPRWRSAVSVEAFQGFAVAFETGDAAALAAVQAKRHEEGRHFTTWQDGLTDLLAAAGSPVTEPTAPPPPYPSPGVACSAPVRTLAGPSAKEGAMPRDPARLPTTNRLLAVADTPEVAADAVAALARAGLAADQVMVLRGDRDADRIDSLGNVGGRWAQVRRLLSFTLADQMVDLAVYVAALRDGRTVLSVLARDDAARERAKRALAGSGAHFVNFFGRFATEDVAPWRGEQLPLPPWLRR